jgi:molybdenum cofactor biosynthesis enzyme MoaA
VESSSSRTSHSREKIAAIPEIKDIGLTTNGILLAEQAQALYDAGLRRLNVSLDALSPAKFKQITRRDGFEKVLEGITEAQRVGFNPVKVNAVSVRGLTEEEIVPFGHFARDTGVDLRFIGTCLDADAARQPQVLLRMRLRNAFANHATGSRERLILPHQPASSHSKTVSAASDHRVGESAVLCELQPLPDHRRRQAAELAVQPRKTDLRGLQSSD